MVNKNKDAQEAGMYAAGGAAGGAGLSVGGTAVGIGMAPIAAAGGVVGLAAYGLKKASSKN